MYTLGGMCRRTTCKRCGKPTWAGCGAHVEMVLGDVPKSERCNCKALAKQPGQFVTTKKAGSAPAPAGALGKFSAWLKK